MCGRVRLCRWVRTWSTRPRSRQIRLSCACIRGADGDFTLYEDENDNYDYEKGAHATIPMHWDDATRTLTIGDRVGSFPGMLAERTFRVVFPDGSGSKEVRYAGRAVSVH